MANSTLFGIYLFILNVLILFSALNATWRHFLPWTIDAYMFHRSGHKEIQIA